MILCYDASFFVDAAMLLGITYGGSAELHAASIIYNTTVYVYQGQTLMDTYNPGQCGEIWLLYDPVAEHYSCLIPADIDNDPIVCEDSLDGIVSDESGDGGHEDDLFEPEFPNIG